MFRYHVCLQIRQDLLTGKLSCPAQTMASLCSYWLQSEYGDWTGRDVDMQVVNAFQFIQKGQENPSNENKSDIILEEQVSLQPKSSSSSSSIVRLWNCPVILGSCVGWIFWARYCE